MSKGGERIVLVPGVAGKAQVATGLSVSREVAGPQACSKTSGSVVLGVVEEVPALLYRAWEVAEPPCGLQMASPTLGPPCIVLGTGKPGVTAQESTAPTCLLVAVHHVAMGRRRGDGRRYI